MKHITVATYNICHGRYVDLNWDKLARVILEADADIVGLQEVDMRTFRVGEQDSLACLADATGYLYYLFVPAMDFDGGMYGTAILSRYPMHFPEFTSLFSDDCEPRSFGGFRFDLEDGRECVFLNTHLAYEKASVRLAQINFLADWIHANIEPECPVILTGDFNTEDFDQFRGMSHCGMALLNNEETNIKTFRNESLAIDNILYRKDHLTPVQYGIVDSDASDHNLLWCRFQLL